jgi:hypothetical protein
MVIAWAWSRRISTARTGHLQAHRRGVDRGVVVARVVCRTGVAIPNVLGPGGEASTGGIRDVNGQGVGSNRVLISSEKSLASPAML